MDPQKMIADALSSRLSMQISLSSLPVVEEWMDARLTRWLESIPLPMEMSADGVANIAVGVSTDLQRLLWEAHGTPRAFIPKLAEYLEASGATPPDLERINGIGESFEPNFVGSWVRVSPEAVSTGWQFEHDFELGKLGSQLGDGQACDRVLRWLGDNGLSRCSNISGALGSPGAALRMPLLAESAADLMARALKEFAPSALATGLGDLVANRSFKPAALSIAFELSEIQSVSIHFGDVRSDDLSAICAATGIELALAMGPLKNALGAEGVTSLAYISEAGSARIEASYVPGTRVAKPPSN